jgi:hypothetical protein
VILIALQASWWLHPAITVQSITHSEPLSNWLFSAIEKLSFANHLLKISGLILVFLIGIIINQIVTSNKIIQQRGFTTGAVFAVLICLINGFTLLSPQLIAFYFTVRIIQKLFWIYGKEKPAGDIFDIGWMSALAMLFYFPSFWLLIFSIISLAILRAFSLREWWMVFIGFFCPVFIVFTWYFWHDKLAQLPSDLLNLSNVSQINFHFTNKEIFALIVSGILLIMCVSALPRILFSSVIQVRKFTTVLLLSALFCVLSFFMQTNKSTLHLITISLPLSIIAAMYLQALKRILIPELIFGLLISCVLIIQFFI